MSQQFTVSFQTEMPIVRDLITQFSGSFTGNAHVAVPWNMLATDMNYEYIEGECLPEGRTLVDPSHLKLEVLSEIWDHWRNRQRHGKQGLIFEKAKPGDAREKLERRGRRKRHQSLSPTESEENDSAEDRSVVRKGRKKVQNTGKAGPSSHPSSPAANQKTSNMRLAFLRKLSHEEAYQKWVSELESTPVRYIVFN